MLISVDIFWVWLIYRIFFFFFFLGGGGGVGWWGGTGWREGIKTLNAGALPMTKFRVRPLGGGGGGYQKC